MCVCVCVCVRYSRYNGHRLRKLGTKILVQIPAEVVFISHSTNNFDLVSNLAPVEEEPGLSHSLPVAR